MTFAFHPEAEAEFSAAIDYYESVNAGLGVDFSIEFLPRFKISWTIRPHGPFWKAMSGAVS